MKILSYKDVRDPYWKTHPDAETDSEPITDIEVGEGEILVDMRFDVDEDGYLNFDKYLDEDLRKMRIEDPYEGIETGDGRSIDVWDVYEDIISVIEKYTEDKLGGSGTYRIQGYADLIYNVSVSDNDYDHEDVKFNLEESSMEENTKLAII